VAQSSDASLRAQYLSLLPATYNNPIYATKDLEALVFGYAIIKVDNILGITAGGGGGSTTVTDNGDGTIGITGAAIVVDNGDGTLSITSALVVDNGDGTIGIS
jgi:hypothetical protein